MDEVLKLALQPTGSAKQTDRGDDGRRLSLA
jgi:hypothetical protein